MRIILTAALPFLLQSFLVADESPAKGKPIAEVMQAEPKPAVFDESSQKKPLVLKSAKEAGKYFAKDELAKLKTQVDFEHQTLLVFAWKGSGQDKLSYAVAESYPEQIFFKYTPGRTRDLRPHVKIYVLRGNVKWSVK